MTSDAAETTDRRSHLRPLHVAGSLVALVTVALAQPLLDLLGRNAAFLVAHNTGPLDVLGLGVGLPIVAPLVAAAVV
ncbi:MAG: hypothetical protein GEU74_16295, partial [Nitriliruptorales bacterium]|nr:hypothetical protein [Nitriliruptorales bacterium]